MSPVAAGKRAFFLALCAATGSLLIASVSAAAPVDEIRERLVHPTPGDVITIAHRSCWKDTAENSLAGVRRCIAMGVDGIEFDVRHTQDGVAVVMHDETVDRTTEGKGAVSALTYRQLERLHLRAGAGGASAAPTDEHVPTLRRFLRAARGRLLLVFDVKDWTQEETFDEARAVGVAHQAIFFYECRDTALLNKIRPFWNQVVVFPIAFEKDGALATSMAQCASHPAGLIHTKWTTAGFLEAAAAQIKSRNERVWIATMFADDVAGRFDGDALADPQSVWGAQIDAGANMIMTNEPGALLSFLRQHGSTGTPAHR